MTNPFSGIISPDLKTLYNNMISALLYDDSLTLPCVLYYGVTRYEDCSNCIYDVIGNKSSNKYQSGGPVPFPFGSICPMCNGRGKRGIESTENINLMVIWDNKQFVNTGTVNSASGDLVQTITFDENTPKLLRAKEVIIMSDKPSLGRQRFERHSSPEPCGWGGSEFMSCLWKRSG